MLTAAPEGSIPPTPSAHRLLPGLPGYLILFAPPAFVPQRQYRSRKPPSPPVFLLISTHFTANQEFHFPLPYSRPAVSNASPRLSREFSHPTDRPAYAPFTPSESEQRSFPPCYRGCWHGVSRNFLHGYRQGRGIASTTVSSPLTGLYTPKSFVTHAALLRQAFAHSAIFPTAVSRRSLGRISVPVWPVTLSGRLSIEALVSFYLTNKLMDRGPIHRQRPPESDRL